MALSSISLFSGVGMLDEGLRAGLDYLGIAHRTLCHIEREAHAAAVLVARMEEGSLDAAPIWPDVTTFDAAAWRGKVDCIVAGFPCQDLSLAGKRAGLDGKRSGLFYEVLRIATDCEARFLFLENVGGIASATATVMDEAEGELLERAASRVVGELADLGWDAEWLHLSASDVGASHGRERWFCLAWKLDDAGRMQRRAGHEQDRSGVAETGRHEAHDGAPDRSIVLANTARYERDGSGLRQDGSGRPWRSDSGGPSLPMAHAERIGSERRRDTGNVARPSGEAQGEARQWKRRGDSPHGGDSSVADPSCSGSQRHQQPATHDQDGRTDGRSRNHADQLPNFIMMSFSHPDQTTPDGPPSSENVPNSRRHLNPLFAAWLMGWPSTWAIAEPHASSAQATALWRCKLRQRLSSLLDAPASHREAA